MLAFVLGGIYIAKNAYLIFEYRVQYRFVYGNMFTLQRRLLNSFLHREYEYFLNIESGEIIQIVGTDTPQVFTMLSTILSFCVEMIVSIALIGTVFVISPFITMCMAGVLLLLMIGINTVLRPKFREAGLQTQEAATGMNKWLLQSVQGIKELLVMHREEYFQRKFDECGKKRVTSLRNYSILSVMPRYLIEAVSMSLMFIIVGFMIYIGQPIEKMVPILTAVAMAALRLLPAANRMSAALSVISYNEPMLDKLIESLDVINGEAPVVEKDRGKVETNSKISAFNSEICMKDVSYSYPNTNKDVLSAASVNIKTGESIGIVGTTGAGKTTFVDVVLGLLTPREGKILVDGTDIRQDIDGWHSLIGYIPQLMFMLDDSIRANVAFGIKEDEIDDNRVWDALKDASLDGFVRDLEYGLDTQIGERGVRLSGGQRQRIGIARALYLNPPVLFFDEATSALDNDTEREIMKSVDHLKGRKTMIIIAHRLSTIEQCDHVYRVDSGILTMER